jgi:hypothetical protein
MSIPRPPKKDAQATEETFSPQKRKSSTSEHRISYFSIFVGHFCPPGSGSGFQFGSGSTYLIESGSNPDPELSCYIRLTQTSTEGSRDPSPGASNDLIT